MGVRDCVAGLLLGAICAGVGHTQTDARISVSQATINAGESLGVNLTGLNLPSVCDAVIYVNFRSVNPDQTFQVVGQIKKGETSSTLSAAVPFDYPGGVFTSQDGAINPCPGYTQTKQITVPTVTVTIKPVPDRNLYPTSAKVELSLTQNQFLNSKSSELGELNNKLDTYVTQNPANTPQLRKYLAVVVVAAEDALTATEKQYREQIMESQGPLPAFFADFHAQYQGLRSDLLGEPPMKQPTVSKRSGATIVYVQLQKKPSGQRLLDTMPSDAIAVHSVIADNQAAYQVIAANGQAIFHARITSVPAGARIRYKKLIDDDYEDYSKPTDVPDATFELATTLFIFQKEGCKNDGVVRINPYQDAHPEIVGNLHCK